LALGLSIGSGIIIIVVVFLANANEERIVSRPMNGKKLVMKEIKNNGQLHAVHQKDDEKGSFKENMQENNKRQQLDFKEMRRKGVM
jgi:hypothetical protein